MSHKLHTHYPNQYATSKYAKSQIKAEIQQLHQKIKYIQRTLVQSKEKLQDYDKKFALYDKLLNRIDDLNKDRVNCLNENQKLKKIYEKLYKAFVSQEQVQQFNEQCQRIEQARQRKLVYIKILQNYAERKNGLNAILKKKLYQRTIVRIINQIAISTSIIQCYRKFQYFCFMKLQDLEIRQQLKNKKIKLPREQTIENEITQLIAEISSFQHIIKQQQQSISKYQIEKNQNQLQLTQLKNQIEEIDQSSTRIRIKYQNQKTQQVNALTTLHIAMEISQETYEELNFLKLLQQQYIKEIDSLQKQIYRLEEDKHFMQSHADELQISTIAIYADEQEIKINQLIFFCKQNEATFELIVSDINKHAPQQ